MCRKGRPLHAEGQEDAVRHQGVEGLSGLSFEHESGNRVSAVRVGIVHAGWPAKRKPVAQTHKISRRRNILALLAVLEVARSRETAGMFEKVNQTQRGSRGPAFRNVFSGKDVGNRAAQADMTVLDDCQSK